MLIDNDSMKIDNDAVGLNYLESRFHEILSLGL